MRERDKYIKIVEWSDEDQCYIGSIPGWMGKCCRGDDEVEVYRKLCTILDQWIDIYKNEKRQLPKPTNKKYPGKFLLRTGQELHQALAMKALLEGESLNSFIIKKLKPLVSG
jgi:predicted HicB family RNase H-like nuclease